MVGPESYYEQRELWNQTLEPYQVQVLADILELIPGDVDNVLDVGCGDGIITNALPEHLDVTGVDISSEALKYVRRKKMLARIEELPFDNDSFDLVMANDILEHLDHETYVRGLAELTRVAKKYILLTVPLLEDLALSTTRCRSCRCTYHVNWHKRSFGIQELLKMFSAPWMPVCLCISGALWTSTLSPLTILRNRLGYYYYWGKAICPQCGAVNAAQTNDDDLLTEALGSVEQGFWQSQKDLWLRRPNRNECIVLWKKQTAARNGEILQEDNGKLTCFAKYEQDNAAIDFSNVAFYLRNNLPSHSPWPAFMVSEGSISVSKEETKILNENGGTVSLIMSFPFSLSTGGKLIIDSQLPPAAQIKIAIYEPLQSYLPIYENRGDITCPIEVEIPPGIYNTKRGTMIKLEISSSPAIFRTARLDVAEEKCNGKWLAVKRGHNIFKFFKEGICWGYSLVSDYNGYIPFPHWLFDLQSLTVERFSHFPVDENKYLRKTLSLLSTTLATKEKQRDIAEKACASAQQEIIQKSQELAKLNLFLEQKERQRDIAEKAYASAQQDLLQAGRTIADLEKLLEERRKESQKVLNMSKRKVQRVLVLSHMFPHPDQPGSGPFVHEQVKALREHEMLDVRVISCRPFWMNTLNPVRLLRAWRYYWHELGNVHWQEWEGVPVLYVPYLTGRLIRFWLHGYTYSWAVKKVIKKVWKEFRFDLVHAHTSYLDGMAGVAVAGKFDLPLVITEHTNPFTYLTEKPVIKQKTLQSIKFADHVLAVSQSLCHEVRSYFPKKAQEKIHYLPNGVNVDRFSQAQNWQPDMKAPKLLFVGFFEFIKGLDVLLKAFQIVCRSIPEARLVLAGGGSEEENLRKLADQLEISNGVSFRGFVSREEVSRLMRQECDIFVLPSRSETFGVVLIEAMACGKPVVATRCGGPESVVTKPFLGRLCKPEDPEDLANNILEVIRSLPAFDPVAIRREVIQNFSYQSLTKKLSLLYEEL